MWRKIYVCADDRQLNILTIATTIAAAKKIAVGPIKRYFCAKYIYQYLHIHHHRRPKFVSHFFFITNDSLLLLRCQRNIYLFFISLFFSGKKIIIYKYIFLFFDDSFDSLKQTNLMAAGIGVAPTAAITIPNNQVNHITTTTTATTVATTNLNGNSMNNNVKTSTIIGSNGNANNGINGLGSIIGDDVSTQLFICVNKLRERNDLLREDQYSQPISGHFVYIDDATMVSLVVTRPSSLLLPHVMA